MATQAHHSPVSLFERKLDVLYLVFFAFHLMIMLSERPRSTAAQGQVFPFLSALCVLTGLSSVIDLPPLYPDFLRPTISDKIRSDYATMSKDRFFIDPPLWFVGHTYLEAAYHLPISVWLIYALIKSQFSKIAIVSCTKSKITCLLQLSLCRPRSATSSSACFLRADGHRSIDLYSRYYFLGRIYHSGEELFKPKLHPVPRDR